ncbi:ICMT-domain-containing protein [Lentinus tigrinus ALCF2SS1-7]|uniref:Protein-S-isoprenylcysteine O-methyltransferase n=1 Tax=Lentinus tigrinus ALCF2SS1-6 TaxID=1328759 RepID=A0A5C2RX58_9APHY|nr:ICMT-domain-containing protein [Lentinus tigrinus ALCF2SS1-6]RPD72569.1 ICMT-domain-containing protein [Lentinus tigrinus ALCF2SS1-7]
MSLVLSTVIATPLLKVPLLVGHAACTYHGMTPPPVPPLPKERRIRAPDFLSWKPHVQKAFAATDKTILCGLAIAEAVTLLAQRAAPTSLLHRTVDALLSAANIRLETLSLRLTSVSAVACFLAISGGLIRWWCHRTLGHHFTWEVGTRDGHQLVTSGPYRIMRHPSYTGMFLQVSGNFMLLLSDGSFFAESGLRGTWVGKLVATAVMTHLTWVCTGMLYRTKTEDEMLKGEFRERWDAWSKKTPYRVIPFVY